MQLHVRAGVSAVHGGRGSGGGGEDPREVRGDREGDDIGADRFSRDVVPEGDKGVGVCEGEDNEDCEAAKGGDGGGEGVGQPRHSVAHASAHQRRRRFLQNSRPPCRRP